MSFLLPWFLAGVVLIGGPIVAHMIRRATRERVMFSQTRFLDASAPRLDKRSRIENPWLLLIRCLIIAVLAAGFARPFIRKDLPSLDAVSPPKSVVVVLDESASMRREGLGDAAKKKVVDIADGLGPNDRFVLIAAAGGAVELIDRDRWNQTPPAERAALVQGVLAGRQPGWGPTRMDAAMETAVAQWEKMTDSAEGKSSKKLVVVSDFAEGMRMAGLSGMVWPKDCEVALEQVAPKNAGNAGVQWLGWAADTGSGPSARVRVINSKDHAAGPLRLQLRDAVSGKSLGEAVPVTVTPGDTQVFAVPVPANAVETPLRIDLDGDKENFDNTVWLTRSAPRDLAVTYYGQHKDNDVHHPLFYLRAATAGWKDPLVKVRNAEALEDGNITAAVKPANEVLVVAAPLPPADLEKVRAKVEAGAFAVVLMADAAMVDTAEGMLGETGWTAVKPNPTRTDAMLGTIDFQHPLFALFADPRYSDFTKVRFWKPQSVKLPEASKVKVVAKFDDGTPAVLEGGVGKGRVVVWGGDWEPGAGQWVLSTKFVPWLQALFERVVGGATRPGIVEMGEESRLGDSGPLQWRAAAAGTFSATIPAEPGVYQLQEGSTAPRWVALEVPAAESRTLPIPVDAWEKLGVPLRAGATTVAVAEVSPFSKSGENATLLEGRQKLWRWLLIAAATLLATESLFAYVLGRRAVRAPARA